MKDYFLLIKILFFDKRLIPLLIAVVCGLSLSLATILSSVGVMGGFDYSLQKALRTVGGDLFIYADAGTFKKNNPRLIDLKSAYPDAKIEYILRDEVFIIAGDESQGCLLESRSTLTDGIELGSALAQKLGVSKGDHIAVAIPFQDSGGSFLPRLLSFKVSRIVHGDLWEVSSRRCWLSEKKMRQLLEIDNSYNLLKFSFAKSQSISEIKKSKRQVMVTLGPDFRVVPFWSGFSSLLEAIEIEKKTIVLVLQVVVVVSIFNLIALFYYLLNKRSREIFLLFSLGVSKKKLFYFWTAVSTTLWGISILGSMAIVPLIRYSLLNLSIFSLPAEVYRLGGPINLVISNKSYLFVYVISFFWVLSLSFFSVLRLRNRTPIALLRRAFS